MKDFKGKMAVVTGGGTGMGRELARQLVAEGCHVATCDIIEENLAETVKLCRAEAAHGARVTGHLCDVAEEDQVWAFRDMVKKEHDTAHINLLFNNAGVGGGGSFVLSDREEWDRVFAINWNGVYNFTRIFLPMLMESTEGHIINISSVNGFRASLGGNIPHTAYSTAKFAVKGFSEGLINDFKINAPHLRVSVVMPGYVGTEIGTNTRKIMGFDKPEDYSAERIEQIRHQWRMDETTEGDPEMSDDEIRAYIQQRHDDYNKGGLTPAQGAAIMLKGVRKEQWRIFVGKDVEAFDRAVRKYPLETYDFDFGKRVMEEYQE